jgi:signal transduction histidine kinase
MMFGLHWIRRVVLLVVLCFATLMSYTLIKLADLQQELSEDVGENMVWATSQAMYQSGLLYQAAQAQQAGLGSSSLMLQRSLVKSRLGMLSRALQRHYMQRAGVWPDIQHAMRLMEMPEPNYAELQRLMHDVGNRVMQAEREDAGARRDTHKQLMWQLMLTVLGVLLSGSVLCWQLFRSLKQAQVANEQIAQQHAEARELVDALELERSARLRYRDFVSLMSHQLRTPLAVIDSSAQRLMRQEPSARQQQNVSDRSQRIRQSVNQLSQLIGRVLEGLRVDEIGREDMASLTLVRCAWQEILEQTIENFGDILERRQLNIRWEPAAEAPIWLHCDRIWCMEILGNLLSNAHKYSPVERPIEVRVQVLAETLSCSVRDFGPGIAEEDRPRIFERFYRGAQAQRVSGIGLGLAIARTLAEWHGGSLTVRNAQGGGAEFTLHLPLGASPPVSAQAALA